MENIAQHYYTKLEIIIKNKISDLNSYDLTFLINENKNTNETFLLLIDFLLNNIEVNKKNSYKLHYYGPLFDFIFRIMNIAKIKSSSELLLKMLTSFDKGCKYLNKLLLDDLLYTDISYLIYACKFGTLPTFLFWDKKIKKNSDDNFVILFENAIINSDDRIFNFLLDNFKSNVFFSNTNFIHNCLSNILTSFSIPVKYQLKRIKILSKKINLKIYYEYMISSVSDAKTILELTKYYYTNTLSFDLLFKIFNLLQNNLNTYKYINELYILLKTDNEKFNLLILNNIYNKKIIDYKNIANINDTDIIEITSNNNITKMFEEINYIVNNQLSLLTIINDNRLLINNNKITDKGKHSINKLIDENYLFLFDNILNELVSNFKNYINDKNPLIHYIFKYLTDNNLVTKYLKIRETNYLISNLHIFYIRYTRFFVSSRLPYQCITINKVLHFLRLCVKKKIKNKFNNFKINMVSIIKEITTYCPDKKYPILKNGSLNYRLNQQKFTTIPPRHLLPYELTLYSHFLLREKADGILINNLPLYSFPECHELYNFQIKAEYIEESDLYLIFDIDIPNTSIIERYNILRNLHPYTKNSKLEEICTLDELNININNENRLLQDFLNSTNNQSCKWYPKAAYEITNITDKMYEDILNFITYDNKLNTLYKSDGLILTPLNGLREIKIKPKLHMTIDLLFTGNNWIDRNKNNLDKLIVINKIHDDNLIANKIYRCYPFIKENILYYYPKEIRYDKKNPNDYKIVEMVNNIYKFDWLSLINNNNIYYENCKYKIDKKIAIQINNQNLYLINQIKSLNPHINKKWLDLGCGKCKYFNEIKMLYNPNKYLGIDNDINCLIKGLKIFDAYPDIFQLYPANLNQEWTTHDIKWNTLNLTIKYDYIIANFSLMHFCNDLFWSQLNKIVNKGTKFIFNLVKKNINWIYNESYLISTEDETKLKFEWVHDNEKNEILITQEILIEYLKKYNWLIISKTENKYNIPISDVTKYNLCDCYDWYIIEKN